MTTTTTSKRTQAREVALQLLFQRDLNPGVRREDITRFVSDQLSDPSLVSLALTIYDHTVGDPAIDDRISRSAENWRLTRMAVIDRNILRMAAGELFHLRDTPANVVFDEAIELAKRYSATDSPAFINGVLDRLHKEWVREQEPVATPTEDPPQESLPTPEVESQLTTSDTMESSQSLASVDPVADLIERDG